MDSKRKLIGEMVSFRDSLKLHHWAITGPASYARHIALDQAIDSLSDTIDRLVETTIAIEGDLNIVIPETINPSNIIEHCKTFYTKVDGARSLFDEIFEQAIIDDFQEGIQQLLYRLIRLQ